MAVLFQSAISLYPSYLPNLNKYSCLTYVHVFKHFMLSIISPLQSVAMNFPGVQESLQLELGTQFSGSGLSTYKE